MVSAEKQQPLWFSRELFADYRTSLILRVSQNEQCDKVYSGTMPHPLINLQKLNQTQILEYKCTLVAEGLLQHNPIESAETFVNGIKANCSNTAKTRSAVDKVLEIVSRTLSCISIQNRPTRNLWYNGGDFETRHINVLRKSCTFRCRNKLARINTHR